MSELKPCPFCGGNPVPDFNDFIDGGEHYTGCEFSSIRCADCAVIVSDILPKKVIEVWNTRFSPDIPPRNKFTDTEMAEEKNRLRCEIIHEIAMEEHTDETLSVDLLEDKFLGRLALANLQLKSLAKEYREQ